MLEIEAIEESLSFLKKFSSDTCIHTPWNRKTTLLSVITDSIQTNVEARAELYLPGASAFVPQDDRLHGFYTCRSYMQHYARLSGLPINQETNERIDRLLVSLGLTAQADTIVGDIFLKGLSGGQKRRLSIALEALTEPNNFFLDEPTSGLGEFLFYCRGNVIKIVCWKKHH